MLHRARALAQGRSTTIAAGLLAIALVPLAGHPSAGDPFWVFAAFVFVTELMDTELPSGRRLCLSLAPGLAFAMLESGTPAASRPAIVGLTFVVASLAAAGIRRLAGREVRLREIAMSFITVTAAAAAYDALQRVGPALRGDGHAHLASGLGIAAVLAIALSAEPLRTLLAAAISQEARPSVATTFKQSAALQVAIVSVAGLVALAFPKLGGWSFPLFLGPLAATRYAFRQITTIRRTEVQTLSALSKIPEMAGYTQPGHSLRVAELAVAMAAEIGVPEPELRDIQYAALLHDIGRVVIADPEGTDVAATPLRHEVATTGANIVAAAGTFPGVASMIREQHQPYRRRGELTDVDVSLGARILKVANTYDDSVQPGVFGKGPWDVLEHLHSGKAYDYDPDVVKALAKVLARKGAI